MRLATVDQLLARLPDIQSDDTASVAKAGQILDEASALVESEIRETITEYDDDTAASALTLYGSGSTRLLVPPHSGAVVAADIAATGGGYLPAFVDTGRYLLATDASGNQSEWIVWPRGAAYSVTAVWGYASVPADLVTATIEISISIYRAGFSDRSATISDLAARALRRYSTTRDFQRFARC